MSETELILAGRDDYLFVTVQGQPEECDECIRKIQENYRVVEVHERPNHKREVHLIQKYL